MNDKKLGENASTLYGAPEYAAWDAERTYRQYDRVSVDGAIYAAKKPSKGVEPFGDDGSNWQFMDGTAHVAGDCFTVDKGNGGAVKVSASAVNGGTAISVGKSDGANTVSADIATAGSLGVVKIGTGLNIDENGTVTANIPVADEHKIGSTNGIAPFYVDQNESGTTVITGKSLVSSATAEVQQDSEYEYSVNVPNATDAKVGVVKPDGDSITADEDGTIHATPYALPVASADTLGGVKVGAGLSVDESGVLSASGGDEWVKLDVVATSNYGFTGEVYKKGNILKICAANRGTTTLDVNYGNLTTVIEFDLSPVVDTKQFSNANRYYSNYISFYTSTSSNPIYPYLQIRGNDARTAATAVINAPAYSNISVPPNCSITCFAILN